jgi:hypothetical protein
MLTTRFAKKDDINKIEQFYKIQKFDFDKSSSLFETRLSWIKDSLNNRNLKSRVVDKIVITLNEEEQIISMLNMCFKLYEHSWSAYGLKVVPGNNFWNPAKNGARESMNFAIRSAESIGYYEYHILNKKGKHSDRRIQIAQSTVEMASRYDVYNVGYIPADHAAWASMYKLHFGVDFILNKDVDFKVAMLKNQYRMSINLSEDLSYKIFDLE